MFVDLLHLSEVRAFVILISLISITAFAEDCDTFYTSVRKQPDFKTTRLQVWRLSPDIPQRELERVANVLEDASAFLEAQLPAKHLRPLYAFLSKLILVAQSARR